MQAHDFYKKELVTIKDYNEIKIHDQKYLLTIPHAGTLVPNELKNSFNLGRMALRDTDLFTDKLYDTKEGIKIIQHLNRYVLNVNRPRLRGQAVQVYNNEDSLHNYLKNMTLSLKKDLPQKDRNQLLSYYDNYHEFIQKTIQQLKQKHGFALLIDCHSMNSKADKNTPDTGKRPHISIGTTGRTTASNKATNALVNAFKQSRFHVVEDIPYKGGYTTKRYGRPKQNIHAIQIEINKDIYMNEQTLKPKNIEEVQNAITLAIKETFHELQT